MRVVSLVPSATETLQAWGIQPVGVTRFCTDSKARKVGGTKDPDLRAIIELDPDLVVMCTEENRRMDADGLAKAGLQVHALEIEAVADVTVELERLARALGVADHQTDALPPRTTSAGRRVFVPIWRRPWMTMNASTYGSSVLDHLGLINVFADAQDRYPTIPWTEVLNRSPEVVLAPSEPYPFAERHVAELSSAAPVVLVDGQDLFWWGTRTPGALRRLGSLLT